ncbi:diguanylate cyclase [Marinobacter daepoensis]|uniref:diguanylate cyclase n=1 Tax=Marinobacter daepoensis TaxID=262077 RepID=A0ABS3BAU3_9GAMM|nr:diguanylate cyclase [Marinobacter daepoensis]MBN7768734.1 diguanylate cyclase [Marinobacter daepoensis]MBY6079471.1 diguanylate cyclase [Marinobacter daepoensis]
MNPSGDDQPGALPALLFQKLASGVPGVLFSYWLSADQRTHYYPYVSAQVQTLFGVEPDQLRHNADSMFEVIHPEDGTDIADSIRHSAETLQPWVYRARLRMRNGEYQWYEAHSVPERQPDGSTLWYGQFHNIHHYKELEQHLRESEAEFSFQAGFQKLVARLSGEFIQLGFGSIDDCIDELLRSIGFFFGVDRAYLYAFSDDHLSMTNTHEWCAPGVRSLIRGQQRVVIEGFQWWQQKIRLMHDQNQVVFIEDVDQLPLEARLEKEVLAEMGVSSMFCVPIWIRGHLMGFFGVDSLSKRRWRRDMADLLIIISGLLSGALERNRLEEDLLNQSIRDPLTGLHNRRYLMPRLEEILAVCNRHGDRFCLAMFDIDHFKRINDNRGHLVGDQVLIRFTELLLNHTRTTDVVARFGGEEFLVVFTEVTEADMEALVMRIMAAVRAEEFVADNDVFNITVSVGAMCVSEMTGAPATPEALIALADHRLYQAKDSGRDCLVDASGLSRL